ncbi:Ubiquinone/menaquinone biosynthesis C-methyltransferase UbiE [Candidatus Thermoflexus japonica]|uniref:Ubiquinone/menaquinone biosynthesis C-methyltransferase UbiE n=1 Tax=Candidatus Thermoflexus japonica TaxID=2035417 RepID=A0A2H5Y950_9CHLR|nr:Ubiquinone/menaquinone biosynthesis C-methyltransferase UbiE [Candidatus Thermoflexus japonica]
MGERGLRVIREFQSYYDDLNGVRRAIAHRIPVAPGQRWLDIGTGDGWFALEIEQVLAPRVVVGIDLARCEVELARQHARESNSRLSAFVQMDAYRLGFPSGIFDGVGTFLALQDICLDLTGMYRLFGEINRVLRPEGWFALATTTPEDAETPSQKLALEIYQYIRAGFFTKTEIREALERMGFQVEHLEFYPTGVNLDPEEAKAFIQFECDWLERAYGWRNKPDWRTVWARFEPRIRALGGLEVDAKVTFFLARKVREMRPVPEPIVELSQEVPA